MRILILILVLSSAVGCTESAPGPSAASVRSNTIQMDDATLFTNGDSWLYSFSANERPCFIVGVDVAYIDRTAEHLIVNLDLTETQESNGLAAGAHTLLDATTNGKHQVLVVRPSGVVESNIEIPQQMDPDAFIREIIASLNAPNAG